MSKETGGFAFPTAGKYARDGEVELSEPDYPGMTLRDYFAAKAMQGMLSCSIQRQSDTEMFARDAYTIADAMLKERAK